MSDEAKFVGIVAACVITLWMVVMLWVIHVTPTDEKFYREVHEPFTEDYPMITEEEQHAGIFSGRQWKQVALSVLQRDGISRMPPMPLSLLEKILAHLQYKQVFNAHVAAMATEPPVILKTALREKRWPAFCHSMVDIVTAPVFLETAIGMYDVARAYFDNEQPRLYSLNAFWTQPTNSPQYKDTHEWHRDEDDCKQMGMFMYGTDISHTTNGAHMYQRGTHRIPDAALGRDCKAPPYEIVETVVGESGTLFLSDTSGLHMGLRPDQPRLLIWARYGVSNPPESYKWDKLSPVPKELIGHRYPKNPELQEAIRLVVA